MPIRLIGLVLTLSLIAAPLAAKAQQPGKAPRIGMLLSGTLGDPDPRVTALRQALRERGYVDGQNIAIEPRGSDDIPRLYDLATDLVQSKVDVIVTQGTPGVQAAQRATRTTPIVMAASGDAVKLGLVASLGRPGGNITGQTIIAAEYIVVVLTVSLAVYLGDGQAQSDKAKSIPRVGYLFLQPFSASSHLRDAFRQGLREQGYVEGQNVAIDFRNAEGRPERLLDLAAELVGLKVDVIVAAPEASVHAAQRATKTIPIVMAVSFDPVGRGFVASLAHPQGNITGLSTVAPELTGKRLELLKEMVPKLSKVAVLWDAGSPSEADQLKEMEIAARTLRVRLQSLPLTGPSPDFESALQNVKDAGSDALVAVDSTRAFGQRVRIADVANKKRLPTLAGFREFAEAGGVMTYGASLPDMHRRAAIFVDKILKGAKPGDLPVEQPTKFELVINMKTAKALGLTIPQTLLLRADQVIE